MIRSPLGLVIGAALTLSIGACARDDTVYPSLASRPIEKLGFAEPEMPIVEAKADPVLDTKIATFRTSLDGLTKGFAADAAAADRAARAARGAAVGSEPWLTAQTALAGLDDRRAQTSALVTEIDAVAVERAATLLPDYPALAPLKDAAQAEVDAQTATIARLQDSLPAA